MENKTSLSIISQLVLGSVEIYSLQFDWKQMPIPMFLRRQGEARLKNKGLYCSLACLIFTTVCFCNFVDKCSPDVPSIHRFYGLGLIN
jgi:hypothetical protein